MLYRKLGKTGLNVSVLTFGAMRIPFDETRLTPLERASREANCVATLKRAAELGIDHIDTARGYGNSESLIGRALKELGRDKFVITTKIPIQPSRDDAWKQIEEALGKLQTDHIDVLDLHGINNMDRLKTATQPDGCLRAAQEAVTDGIVGHLGFSSHAGPDVIVAAMETGLFSVAGVHYWWTNQRNAPAVARAAELGIGVAIISPAEKGGMLFRPTDELREVCHPFHPLALTHRWLLAQSGVTTLTVGAATPEEFDPHLAALECHEDQLLPEEESALARWTRAEQEALGNTRCTICYRCMPCPQDVAIPEILRLRNLVRTFGMTEFGAMRYNLLGQGGHWFPGRKVDACNRCGECLPLCPERLAIPDLLDDTDRLLAGAARKRLWE